MQPVTKLDDIFRHLSRPTSAGALLHGLLIIYMLFLGKDMPSGSPVMSKINIRYANPGHADKLQQRACKLTNAKDCLAIVCMFLRLCMFPASQKHSQ